MMTPDSRSAAAAAAFSSSPAAFLHACSRCRVRLRWSGGLRGLTDCWEEVPHTASTVKDLEAHIRRSVLGEKAPPALSLSLDGFRLRPASSVQVLRDGDLLEVEPSPSSRSGERPRKGVTKKPFPRVRAASKVTAEGVKERSRVSLKRARPATATTRNSPGPKRLKVAASRPGIKAPAALRAKGKGASVSDTSQPNATAKNPKKASTGGGGEVPGAKQEKKTPSRSARRKAAKRRLRRQGVELRPGLKASGASATKRPEAEQAGKADGAPAPAAAAKLRNPLPLDDSVLSASALDPNGSMKLLLQPQAIRLMPQGGKTIRDVTRLASAQRKGEGAANGRVESSSSSSSSSEDEEDRGPAAPCGKRSTVDSGSSSSSSGGGGEDDSSSEDESSSSEEEASSSSTGGEEDEPAAPLGITEVGASGGRSKAQEQNHPKLTAAVCASLPRLVVGQQKEGMVVAYRLVEIGPSLCPEVSEWRAGLVEAVEPWTLLPWVAAPYPPLKGSTSNPAEAPRDDSDDEVLGVTSLYDQDGRLRAGEQSFADLRLMGNNVSEAWECLAAGGPTPGPVTPQDAPKQKVEGLQLPAGRLSAAAREPANHQMFVRGAPPPPSPSESPGPVEQLNASCSWAALAAELAAKKAALAASIHRPQALTINSLQKNGSLNTFSDEAPPIPGTSPVSGVSTPGAIKHGGARRSALGPLLAMLRNS